LRKRGYHVFINHEDVYSGRGRSDLTVCARGHFVALECKKPNNRKPTPAQRNYLLDVVRAGGFASLVSSAEEAVYFVEKVVLEDIDFGRLETNGRHREEAGPSPTQDVIAQIQKSAEEAKAAALAASELVEILVEEIRRTRTPGDDDVTFETILSHAEELADTREKIQRGTPSTGLIGTSTDGFDFVAPEPTKHRGRPKGSKNRPKQ